MFARAALQVEDFERWRSSGSPTAWPGWGSCPRGLHKPPECGSGQTALLAPGPGVRAALSSHLSPCVGPFLLGARRPGRGPGDRAGAWVTGRGPGPCLGGGFALFTCSCSVTHHVPPQWPALKTALAPPPVWRPLPRGLWLCPSGGAGCAGTRRPALSPFRASERVPQSPHGVGRAVDRQAPRGCRPQAPGRSFMRDGAACSLPWVPRRGSCYPAHRGL